MENKQYLQFCSFTCVILFGSGLEFANLQTDWDDTYNMCEPAYFLQKCTLKQQQQQQQQNMLTARAVGPGSISDQSNHLLENTMQFWKKVVFFCSILFTLLYNSIRVQCYKL